MSDKILPSPTSLSGMPSTEALEHLPSGTLSTNDNESDELAEISLAMDSHLGIFIKECQAEKKAGNREPPQKLLLSLDESLTLPPLESQDRQAKECLNTKKRPRMWAVDDDQDLVNILVYPRRRLCFLNRLGQLCVKAQIRDCYNEECLRNRKLMENVVPACQWESFRKWALVLISCQKSFTHQQKLTRAHTHLVAAVSLCHSILKRYRERHEEINNVLIGKQGIEQVDLYGVCDVIYWMLTAEVSMGVLRIRGGSWGPQYLPQSVILPAIVEAVEKARKLGLCPNRLWNLAIVSERKQADLPGLMETAQHHQSLTHRAMATEESHDECTGDFCFRNTIDSTKVKQLHKCRDLENCKLLEFPSAPLEESLANNRSTAWSLGKPPSICQGEPYVALSHVWSDGTGIGPEKAGLVNSCLSNYFTRIVERLQCAGIWWDTISIPTEPNARRKAINAMHGNYANASCTVVHDRYLLQFDWAGDGSPCLAIVLSPWFTRGWTALELAVSKTVKVLFKGASDEEPLIKDLDNDILAQDPSQANRAHWIASSLIRRLRKPIGDVSDLLAILKPRSTSWARDRMIIAGLLAELPNYDYYERSMAEITRAILIHVRDIPRSCLLHGHSTMCDTGGFSWCPVSLYDLPADSVGDLLIKKTKDRALTVDSQGCVIGFWCYRRLDKHDAIDNFLVPYSFHLSVEMRVKAALQQWWNCLLLRERGRDAGPALLVTTVGKELCPDRPSFYDSHSSLGLSESLDSFERSVVDCRYIGSVQEKVFIRKYNGQAYVRLGNERGRLDANVVDVIGAPEDRSREGSDSGRGFDSDDRESLPPSDDDIESEEDDEDKSWITEEEDVLSQSSSP